MRKRIIIVVVAAIRYKNKFLLTKRIHEDKVWHDKWQLPGGELEYNESTKACIKREIMEELGITLKEFIPIPYLFENLSYGKGKSHILLIPYLSKVQMDNFKIKLDDEASAYGWYSINEVKKLKKLDGTLEIIKETNKLPKTH